MRKLICAKDIEEAIKENKTTLYIEKNTIITPSAKDMADEFNINFLEKQESSDSPFEDNMFKLFNLLNEKGMLEQFLKFLKKPYYEKISKNGVKIIDGNTIKLEKLKINNKKTNINNLEIMSFKNSDLSLGLMEILDGEIQYQTIEKEIYYLTSGKLEIMIDDEKFIAKTGDIVFIPENVDVKCNSKENVKMLYVKLKSNK